LGHVKKVIKDKEGKPKNTIEYLDANLHDSGVKRMLELGYEMYRVSLTRFTLIVISLTKKLMNLCCDHLRFLMDHSNIQWELLELKLWKIN
jgi:hypothetical protein